MLIRRQNPVRHLRRNVVTRLLIGSRLAEAPPIFVYDGQFDLVVWRDAVLITRDTALDSVFLTQELRERQTREAAAALAGSLRPADATALNATLAADHPSLPSCARSTAVAISTASIRRVGNLRSATSSLAFAWWAGGLPCRTVDVDGGSCCH